MSKTSYCVCKIEKIKSGNTKTAGSLRRRFEHNYRTYTPSNVDKELTYLNKDLLPLKNGNYVNEYNETVKNAIINGTMKSVRKNAVLGIEVVLTYTKSDFAQIDVNEWGKDSVEWLKQKFGEDNLKGAIMHCDEPGGPHIHAFVVPMNEKGYLSAKSFIDGPSSLRKMQTEYAEQVGEKYGLSRGVKYTSVKNGDIRRFKQNTIGAALVTKKDFEPRETELDETGHILPTYVDRVVQVLEKNNFQHLAEKNELQQNYNIEQSKMYQERLNLKRIEEEYEKKLKKLANLMNSIKDKILKEEMTLDELSKMIKTYDTLERGLKNYPDRDKAHKVAENMNEITKWQRSNDKIKEREINDKLGL